MNTLIIYLLSSKLPFLSFYIVVVLKYVLCCSESEDGLQYLTALLVLKIVFVRGLCSTCTKSNSGIFENSNSYFLLNQN